MRLTLDEYSKHFKMSKEMINAKLRSKRLNYIIEDGTTYIIVPSNQLEDADTAQQSQNKLPQESFTTTLVEKKISFAPPSKPKTTVAMVLGLYQRENKQLKEKIVELEKKIDKLIDDKEQMLRAEMSKIEGIYNEKDKQLKNILELLNAKFAMQNKETIHNIEHITVPKERDENSAEEIVELKSYLKTLDLEPYQRKIIKKRFLAAYHEDIRIIKQNGNIYLNFSKYDYSDLLDY